MTNYRQIYVIRAERESRIKSICPNIPQRSGIYIFYRVDENGFRFTYVGQAVNLLQRTASHLGEYDHIGLSLKKHGLKSEKKPYGWNLTYKEFPKSQLDEKEQKYIKEMADKGWQLHNVVSGGNEGKTQLKPFKAAKGYHDGIKQGKLSLARELSDIIQKHLTVSLKESKANNKTSKKMMDKFWDLIDVRNYEE